MKPEIKERWVAALRSGEYEQATGGLRTKDKFCAGGVLCDVVGVEWEKPHETLNWYMAIFNGEQDGGAIPPTLLRYLDLTYEAMRSIERLNDKETPFAEIADYIEANL